MTNAQLAKELQATRDTLARVLAQVNLLLVKPAVDAPKRGRFADMAEFNRREADKLCTIVSDGRALDPARCLSMAAELRAAAEVLDKA